MNWKKKFIINTDRFLREAFDSEFQQKLIRSARLRRNVYLWVFLIGTVSMFIAALTNHAVLSFLLAGLSALSLVIMTKYDTQLFFLRLIKDKKDKLGNNPLAF